MVEWYGRMQNKIPPRLRRLACGSRGTCLDCMLPGIQVTAGLGFFCAQVIELMMKTVTPCC